jgi:hypothetical protein
MQFSFESHIRIWFSTFLYRQICIFGLFITFIDFLSFLSSTILADYQALLKLPAADLPEGDRVVGGADSVEDETVNRGKNE